MLKCLQRDATFTIELDGHDELPPERRPRLECRYLTCEEDLAWASEVSRCLGVESGAARMAAIAAALDTVVLRVHNVAGVGRGSELPRALTPHELMHLVLLPLSSAQAASEADRSKSQSRQGGAAADSAVPASPAAA